MARKLTALAQSDDRAYLASLERIVVELVKSQQLEVRGSNPLMKYLWSHFDKDDNCNETSGAAILLLAFICRLIDSHRIE